MKFALFSLLVAAVHGSAVAPVNRELQQDFHITAAEVQDDPRPLPFVITYAHADIQASVIKYLVITEGDCPGAAGYSNPPESSNSVDGVTFSMDTSVPTETVVTIDVQPTGGSWSNGEEVEKFFCAWLGVASGTETYGYFPVKIEATFVFDGTWDCKSFNTQAYSPVTGVTKKTISTTVSFCGDFETNQELGQPLMTGELVCIEVCPVAYTEDSGDPDTSDLYCLVAPMEVFKIDDAGCPDPCDGSSGTDITEWTQYDSVESANGCIQTTFNIPLWYHEFSTTLQTLYLKGKADFELCEEWTAPAPAQPVCQPITGGQQCVLSPTESACTTGADWKCNCEWNSAANGGLGACQNKGRRLENMSRKLQSSDTARIDAEVKFTTAPIEEESSASGAMVGVAAAAAVGAAFLI